MNCRFLLTGILFFSLTARLLAFIPTLNERKEAKTDDSVKMSMDYLKSFLRREGNWYPRTPELERELGGLIHYIEDEELDTVLLKLNNYRETNQYYFRRSPGRVPDSLSVPGYISRAEVNEQLKRIDREARSTIVREHIIVPDELFRNIDSKVKAVPANDAEWLVRSFKIILPDSLKNVKSVHDTSLKPAEFKKVQHLDSVKRAFLEQSRIDYNNQVRKVYIDSVSNAYRNDFIDGYSKTAQLEYSDSIKQQNYSLLVRYNDSMTRIVNDSIDKIIVLLTQYASDNYAIPLWLQSSGNDSTMLRMRNNDPQFRRLFIKNEQNDSVGIRIVNTGRQSLKLQIDDAVTFNRFVEQTKKDAHLPGFERGPQRHLHTVQQRFQVRTPWILTAIPNLSLTHTTLENWKAGGRNSYAFLFVLNGTANYAKDNVSWKNSIQFRNGWIKKGGEKVEKNDDKIQLITRYGLKAAKKWNYSGELDFQTQFFNGYSYSKDPERQNPISAFMSPASTVIKFGMEYNPDKNLSLLLSPVGVKLISVSDTAKVDQTSYGIDKDKKAFWQAGFSTDLNWSKQVIPSILYTTKYSMFNGYENPFKKLDISWENNLAVQINTYINLMVRLYLVYDDDVTFNTGRVDNDGIAITETRWQVKELITLGFTYTFNKPIYRRNRL